MCDHILLINSTTPSGQTFRYLYTKSMAPHCVGPASYLLPHSSLYFTTPQTTCTTCFLCSILQNISSLWKCHPHPHFKHGATEASSLTWGGWGGHCPCAAKPANTTTQHPCLQHASSLSSVDSHFLLTIFIFTDSEYPYSSYFVFSVTSSLYLANRGNQ